MEAISVERRTRATSQPYSGTRINATRPVNAQRSCVALRSRTVPMVSRIGRTAKYPPSTQNRSAAAVMTMRASAPSAGNQGVFCFIVFMLGGGEIDLEPGLRDRRLRTALAYLDGQRLGRRYFPVDEVHGR